MKRLRLLQLGYVKLTGDYEYLSKDLCWLCGRGYPLKCIPGNVYQKNLVAIDLKFSNLQIVWKEPQAIDVNLESATKPLIFLQLVFHRRLIVLFESVTSKSHDNNSNRCTKGWTCYDRSGAVLVLFLLTVLCDLLSVQIINYTRTTLQTYKQDTTSSLKDEKWQGLMSNLEPGDEVEVVIVLGHRFKAPAFALVAFFLLVGCPLVALFFRVGCSIGGKSSPVEINI
ncbi:hypothetical protein RJT34_07869 [Clitoria ternatea]|uniref:Uncharacterized protein n=1 Tax=Clitoria ternatea TaxID=43366 RepID=A0AAN9K5L9_CLITE